MGPIGPIGSQNHINNIMTMLNYTTYRAIPIMALHVNYSSIRSIYIYIYIHIYVVYDVRNLIYFQTDLIQKEI